MVPIEVVMNFLTRSQYVDSWNRTSPGLGDPDSPIWEGEKYRGIECNYFVTIKPTCNSKHRGVPVPDDDSPIPDWAKNYLKGNVLCYNAGDITEEWGLTDYDDIVLFLLRWS